MISFNLIDIIIIVGFLTVIILIGLLAGRKKYTNSDDYLLSGRKVGLFLFILTNVATWYGGILGVGEFSYRFGLVSWITQGLPYYIFALIFAFFFAGKIRSASLYTIPDKLSEVYGYRVGLISAILIFILVSPAPYLLILGKILTIIFNIDYLPALFISGLVSSIYLIRGGYKSNIWTDAFSFFIMFLGFFVIVIVAIVNYGGSDFLSVNLPPEHLTPTGGNSFVFIIVWFLIALWTFTDPGFHQRCYSAISEKVAKWGIIYSVFLWFIFDFLTNTTGLYSRAILPDLPNPVLSFPFLADKILDPGLKGLFFAALIATVLSTLNSFIFLSATTFSRDFIFRINKYEKKNQLFNCMIKSPESENENLIRYTKIGILITVIVSIIIAYFFESVVELWYTIGSLCIPGIILLVFSSYYQKFKISKKIALVEVLIGIFLSLAWLIIRKYLNQNDIYYILEPMIVGLIGVLIVHIMGLILRNKKI